MPNPFLDAQPTQASNALIDGLKNYFSTARQAVVDPNYYLIAAGGDPDVLRKSWNVLTQTPSQFLPYLGNRLMDVGHDMADSLTLDAARTDPNAALSNALALATAFHGSPHKFDRFDSSKIGTGEGAQAYGHGLYLADSPDVAKTYAPAVMEADVAENLARMRQMLPSSQGTMRKNLERAISEIEGGYGGGQFYQVDIPDEAVARMLNWDKPLSEQPEAVREALYSMSGGWVNDGGMRRYIDAPRAFDSGEKVYRNLSRLKGGDKAASEALAAAGIPGIRYLDGVSRDSGAGTYNTVLFDDSLAKILSRNGQPVQAE